jgi:putative oxidoreductase
MAKKTSKPASKTGFIGVAAGFLSHPGTLAFFKVFMGAVFLISSSTGILEPGKFSDSIEAYKILPKIFIMPMAHLVPMIEALAGLFLILDIYAQSSAFIISGLLVVYIIAITSAWIRGFDIDCGCFDLLSQFGLEDKVGLKAVIRDLFFLAFSGCVFLFDKNGLNFYGFFNLFKKK